MVYNMMSSSEMTEEKESFDQEYIDYELKLQFLNEGYEDRLRDLSDQLASFFEEIESEGILTIGHNREAAIELTKKSLKEIIISEKENRISQLYEKIASLKSVVRSYERKIKTLQEENDSINHQYQDLSEKFSATLTELESDVNERDRKFKEKHQKEVQEIHEHYQQLLEKKQENVAKHDRTQKLQEIIDNSQTDLKQLRESIEHYKQAYEDSLKSFEESELKAKALEDEKNETVNQLQVATNILEELQQNFNFEVSKKKQAEIDINKFKDLLKAEEEAHSNTLHSLNAKLDSLFAQINQKKEKIEILESENETKNKKINEMGLEVDNLNRQMLKISDKFKNGEKVYLSDLKTTQIELETEKHKRIALLQSFNRKISKEFKDLKEEFVDFRHTVFNESLNIRRHMWNSAQDLSLKSRVSFSNPSPKRKIVTNKRGYDSHLNSLLEKYIQENSNLRQQLAENSAKFKYSPDRRLRNNRKSEIPSNDPDFRKRDMEHIKKWHDDIVEKVKENYKNKVRKLKDENRKLKKRTDQMAFELGSDSRLSFC